MSDDDLPPPSTSEPVNDVRLADLLRTPTRWRFAARGREFDLDADWLPAVGRLLNGESTLRQILRSIGRVLIVSGAALLFWGTSTTSNWSPVLVEAGGALLLFGALTIATHPLTAVRRVTIWGVAAIAGVSLVLLAVYADLGERWETAVFEVGVGAFLFIALDKLFDAGYQLADRWERSGGHELVITLGVKGATAEFVERQEPDEPSPDSR